MTQFNGFREGCPGYFRDSPPMHSGTEAVFQVNKKWAVELSGRKPNYSRQPTAIRVIAEDDYEGSMYQDRVLAFSPREAETYLGDRKIIEGGIRVLSDEEIISLNGLCISCEELRPGEPCPVLQSAVELVKRITPTN